MSESNTIQKINYFYEEVDKLNKSLSWLESKVATTDSEEDLKYLYLQILDEQKKHKSLTREFLALIAEMSHQ